MKVYLLEAVDPEDRKLRQRKLLDKSRSLHRGHIAALQAGDKQSAEKLFIRSMRANYIARRDKPNMDAYRSTIHADRVPSHLGSMPKGKGVDPENRKVRLRHILDKAKKLRGMASVSRTSAPDQASKMIMNARIHTDLANAYRKGGGAKLKWQNVYRDMDRNLRRKMQGQSYKSDPPAMSPAQAHEWKAGMYAKDIDFQWRPFIKKGSKVNRMDRSKRLAKVMFKADDIKKAKEHFKSGNREAAKALGVPGKAKGMWAGGDKAAIHHGLDLQRAHSIVAKFLKRPGHREKLNRAIQLLRKGKSTIGIKGLQDVRHPLKQFGIKSEGAEA